MKNLPLSSLENDIRLDSAEEERKETFSSPLIPHPIFRNATFRARKQTKDKKQTYKQKYIQKKREEKLFKQSKNLILPRRGFNFIPTSLQYGLEFICAVTTLYSVHGILRAVLYVPMTEIFFSPSLRPSFFLGEACVIRFIILFLSFKTISGFSEIFSFTEKILKYKQCLFFNHCDRIMYHRH